MGTTNFWNNTIALDDSTPFNSTKGTAYAINIHKAGRRNLTGSYESRQDGKLHYVSEGCLLIDRDNWDKFVDIFHNDEQKNNIVGVTVNR